MARPRIQALVLGMKDGDYERPMREHGYAFVRRERALWNFTELRGSA